MIVIETHLLTGLLSLHWLPIIFLNYFSDCIFHPSWRQASKCITDLLTPAGSPPRDFKSTGQNLLVIPESHFKTKGICLFSQWLPDFGTVLFLCGASFEGSKKLVFLIKLLVVWGCFFSLKCCFLSILFLLLRLCST